jgi:hypothetical protein
MDLMTVHVAAMLCVISKIRRISWSVVPNGEHSGC